MRPSGPHSGHDKITSHSLAQSHSLNQQYLHLFFLRGFSMHIRFYEWKKFAATPEDLPWSSPSSLGSEPLLLLWPWPKGRTTDPKWLKDISYSLSYGVMLNNKTGESWLLVSSPLPWYSLGNGQQRKSSCIVHHLIYIISYHYFPSFSARLNCLYPNLQALLFL